MASLFTIYIDGVRIAGKGYASSTTFEITSNGINFGGGTQEWTYSGDSVFAGFSQNNGANIYPIGTTGVLTDFVSTVETIHLDSIEESESVITYYKVSNADLKSVADAIRAKSGASEALVYPDGFVSAIESIVG